MRRDDHDRAPGSGPGREGVINDDTRVTAEVSVGEGSGTTTTGSPCRVARSGKGGS